MTDIFGIGTALHAVTQVYFTAARRTGRTTAMVESLRDGDRVVFFNHQEAQRVGRLCKEVGKQVECLTVPVDNCDQLLNRVRSPGRTIFDHTWLEQRYKWRLGVEADAIRNLGEALSGRDAGRAEQVNYVARWRE